MRRLATPLGVHFVLCLASVVWKLVLEVVRPGLGWGALLGWAWNEGMSCDVIKLLELWVMVL